MAEDTTIYAYRFLHLPEDNGDEYMVLCPSHPADGSTAALMLLSVDEEHCFKESDSLLFLRWRKRFSDAKSLKEILWLKCVIFFMTKMTR